MNKIICGDCLIEMKKMKENSIDTIITDPPYGIGFMGKEWDTFKQGEKEHERYEKRNKNKKVDKYLYDISTGKMKHVRWAVPSGGRGAGSYDFSRKGMIGFQKWMTEIAKEMLRVTKPGGTLLIFGGTRTYHRLACAIEDAGWILKDCIMWIYGSGFPKATDISKQLDKRAGKKGKIVGEKKHAQKGVAIAEKRGAVGGGAFGEARIEEIREPATPEAKLWNGWKSHGLKPAYEPIIVAMKPNEGSYAENALKHGVAGLNIDGGRIGHNENLSVKRDGHKLDTNKQGWGFRAVDRDNKGRFPSNIILDQEAAKMLDEMSGESGSGSFKKGSYRHKAPNNLYQLGTTKKEGALQNAPDDYGDKGGASRFFYVAKASKAERNVGKIFYWKDGKEITKELYDKLEKENENLPEGKKYTIAKGNIHPTCKPLKLMEYLCILTKTPAGGIVLDPFAGSCTTAMACKLTKRPYIMIEKEAEYVRIGRARVDAVPEPLL